MKGKKVQKNQKIKEGGITLIALVITIIVLLILAGVTLAALTGDSGILRQAIRAKEQMNYATARESIELAITSAYINDDYMLDESILKNELDKLGASYKSDLSIINYKGYSFSFSNVDRFTRLRGWK